MTHPRKAPRRRRFSIWTVLAPAALLLVFASTFSALKGTSLLGNDSSGTARTATSTQAADSGGTDTGTTSTTGSAPKRRFVSVKPGDSLAAIAAREGTTTDELVRLNRQLSDPQSLQVGTKIRVR